MDFLLNICAVIRRKSLIIKHKNHTVLASRNSRSHHQILVQRLLKTKTHASLFRWLAQRWINWVGKVGVVRKLIKVANINKLTHKHKKETGQHKSMLSRFLLDDGRLVFKIGRTNILPSSCFFQTHLELFGFVKFVGSCIDLRQRYQRVHVVWLHAFCFLEIG